jgi:hypothetical protein
MLSEFQRFLKSTTSSFPKAPQLKIVGHTPEHVFIAHPKTNERSREACQLGNWNVCM